MYGLLGIAAENKSTTSASSALRSNYELDVIEVYTNIAHFFLQECRNLSIPSRATGISDAVSQAQRKHQFKLLPSWVPNWCDYYVEEREVAKSLSWLFHPHTIGAATLGFPEHYNASAGLPLNLLKSPDRFILRLSALEVDAVISAIQFKDDLDFSRQNAQVSPLLQFWEAAVPFSPEGEVSIDWIASWVRATTAEHHVLSGRTAEQMLKDGAAYLHRRIASSRESCQTGSQDVLRMLRELSVGGDPGIYAALASNFCRNRTFIVTQKGRMGISPLATRPGDAVFVIFGGGVPYVLRTRTCGSLFVGESYIDGLMAGEAVKAWRRGDLSETSLEIL